jgi:hypothetical protein
MESTNLTDQEMKDTIKQIVKEEIKNDQSFIELSNIVNGVKRDVTDIKKALLGDEEYQDKGLLKQSIEVIDHYRSWQKHGLWDAVEEMIKQFDRISWLSTFLGFGSLAGIIAFVGGLVAFISWLMETGKI